MAEIVLDKVTKRYPDGHEAVKGAEVTIGDGEFFILVGPSGCGKSTLLNMIVGLEDITEGEMRVDGQRVNDVDPKDRNMAMVFQSYAIYPHMTVRQNMEFPLKLRKMSGDEVARRVEEAAGLLELTEHLDRRPGHLSGGQRQRVAMGRAIVREPAAFLMDEPLSNLDAKLRVQMRTTISKLQQRLGTTTVYVTHDQVEAMTLGDRVAVMRRGVVQQVGSPRELYRQPANLFVAGFIGSPAMNLLPGELDGRHLRLPMVEMELAPDVADRLVEGAQGKVIAGIRPENFEDVALVGDPDAPGVTFTADIDVIEWLGSELFAHFEVAGSAAQELTDLAADLETVAIGRAGEDHAEVVARLDVRSEAREGRDLELWLDTRSVHLFDPDSGDALVRRPD
ncbi:MAG TPA: sn-glycerol-3-phosphate ABC transporter ATP-binding protein UgpC [Acidimicrobiales bacterium]|nr:sn-glycerol-3-phosphate ABC transporter ATP-binding protein UgpC [Acidimicrobiales bacterium]